MRPGRLRDRIIIQTATYTEGEYEDNETWGNSKSRACEIRPLRAVDYYAGNGNNVDAVHEVRMRYESGLLNEKMRLLDTRVSPNRIFDNIVIVDQGNRHREIVMTVTERRWPLKG
jgi:head-tail adaptor